MSPIKWKYRSLDDYLTSRPLDVDGVLDDGWGAHFPVKARQIEAAILFVDIAGFTARTQELQPIETLIFINNFFTWISAEALIDTNGIIDKYIGDELMIVFSRDFGSENPFLDAMTTARRMAEHDHLGFSMHIGIAVGQVAIGYTGTPLKYSCTTVGSPVNLAKRCSGISTSGFCSSYMIFPKSAWHESDYDKVFYNRKIKDPDGKYIEVEHGWVMQPSRKEALKGIGEIEVIEVYLDSFVFSQISATDRARQAFQGMKKSGEYHPRRYRFEEHKAP